MAINYGIVGNRELITAARTGVIEFPAPNFCQLNRLYMRISAANPAGDTTFDVKKNGVTIYGSPVDRPKILLGETISESFPSVELNEGDMVTVDVVSVPASGISGLYIIVQLQDAVTIIQYILDSYNGALNRDPTGPELSAAETSLGSACAGFTTLAQTKIFFDDLFLSAEYIALATTNSEYVEDLYTSILGRPSDPGGHSYWLAQLTGGATRQALRDEFNGSLEHIRRVQGWCPSTAPITNAEQLQGQNVSAATPTAGQTLLYVGGQWVPTTPSPFVFKGPARAATTGALPSYTSTGGVITATSNGALPAQDGVTLVAGDELLVKNESGGNQKYNGKYAVTQVGSGGTPFILTRAADMNVSAEVSANILIPVSEGTTLADTAWWLTTNNPIVLDTTALTFTQFGAGISLPAGGTVGQLLTKNSSTDGDASWQTPSAIFNVADEIFQTQDDGFDATSLDAKWTLSTTGTAPTLAYNPKEARSCVLAKFGAADGAAYFTQAYTPGAVDFSITGKFHLWNTAAVQLVNLGLWDTAVTNGIRVNLYRHADGSYRFQYTEQPGDANATEVTFNTNPNGFHGTVFIHVQRVSTTWTVLFSFDGIAWAVAKTSTVSRTINKIRFGFDQVGATAKTRMACAWIRRDWFTY